VLLLELTREVLGFLGRGVGCVVHYEVAAFACEVGADGGADASGCTGYDGELAFEDSLAGCGCGSHSGAD
jgi:hypothetical protein